MQNDRWRQIETLFHQALERPLQERGLFLGMACGADAALRGEVESLLAAQGKSDGLLETPAADLAAEWAKTCGRAPGRTEQLKQQAIGPYQILYKLGKGGMGEVYLAEDSRLRRKVALKLLPAEIANQKERLRRFKMEAQAASATNHPNIITIYEIGVVDSVHFLATEFVEGQTLRKLMTSRELQVTDALDIAIQIAGALSAAHAAGVRHRDIKPENIMVRPDGVVKVLDFGLAKMTEPRAILTNSTATTFVDANTMPGMVVGTAQYMSPEQTRGLEVDHRTDIFSLGVVLYEMVTGDAPFSGEEIIDVMASIAHRKHVPLSKLAPTTPLRLEQIVNQALQKNRDQRYQNAADLLNDLKALKQELDAKAWLSRFPGDNC
ncbi:MAG: serine/threonine protein kinase [Acidobacteria bacterium]|nr:serine/threonine protein kinase [Acidobacteriota bacterium]